MRSAANLPLIFGDPAEYLNNPEGVASINIKLYPVQDRQPFAQMEVHDACGSKISYLELCHHCDRPLSGPALGGKAPQPTKQTACNHMTCKKALDPTKIESEPYCDQETCTRKLKPGEVQTKYYIAKGEKNLVTLTPDELAKLNALRLSEPGDGRDAFKYMVVRGLRQANDRTADERYINTRQVVGQATEDQQALWEMLAHVSATGERLVVHYALRHEQEVTGEYEHVALLGPSSNGKSMMLFDLLSLDELRPISEMPDDFEASDEALDNLRAGFAALPVLKDGHADLNKTRFNTSLEGLHKSKIEGGQYTHETFVDHDGMVRAAAGRYFFKFLRRAVAVLDTSTSNATSE